MLTKSSTPTSRSGKIRAVLAGGLVLGVGAAMTLAAWNDSEFVQGNFGAGTFNLEGSTDITDPEAWGDHADTGSAAVVFDTSAHGNLAPEDVVYESFWVRLAEGTTSPATLSFVGVTPGTEGNEANLSYDIYADPTGDCDADGATSGTPIGSGTSLNVATPGTSVALATGEPTTEPGAAVQLCFVVTAGADLDQGDGASTVWEFEAVSTDQ